MHLRLYIFVALLALGCGTDRAPWGGPGDVAPELVAGDGHGEVADLSADLSVDLVPELLDAAPELVDTTPDLPDSVPELPPELTDLVPDVPPEVMDTEDAGEIEVCAPDCEGKECGADGCGGSCGLCPENKPLCTMGFQCEACDADCEDKVCGGDGCGGSCGTCPLGWTCISGDCEPPACQSDQVLYQEAFDACNEGAMVVVDDQPEDAVTWMAMEEGALSYPCALHLGDPVGGSYDTGDPVSAALHLPAVAIPDDGDPYSVTFAIRMDAEPVVAPEYPYDHDVLFLRAYGEDLDSDGEVLFSSKEFLNNSEGAWLRRAVSLVPYQGKTLELRFEFDTIDSADNNYQGIWLDDVRVGTACPLCFEDDDCVDDEPCLADLCVLFSNQGEFGTCGHLPKDFCCVGLDLSWCDDGDPCTEDGCDPVSGDCTHEIIEDCGQ